MTATQIIADWMKLCKMTDTHADIRGGVCVCVGGRNNFWWRNMNDKCEWIQHLFQTKLVSHERISFEQKTEWKSD